MTGEQQLRWSGFIAASFVVHAAALSWLDLSGADIGQLPSRLTVLILSSGEGEAQEQLEAPASASRSRDLFSRPPAREISTEPVESAEKIAQPADTSSPPEPMTVAKVHAEDRPPVIEKAAEVQKTKSSAIEQNDTPLSPSIVAMTDPAPVEDVYRDPPPSAAAGESAMTSEPAYASEETDAGTSARRGELLSLLHEAISREKRYPMLALRQRREGTATVSFRLSPSGEMDAVGVDRSSGFSLLDTAAVSAVSRVAPFEPARLFLSDVTRFRVDVTFKLN